MPLRCLRTFAVFISLLGIVFGARKPRGNDAQRKVRIIGGEVASPSDFPLGVYIKKIGGRGITCTGELINKRWIVTAAHCLLNDNDSGYRSPLPLGNTQVVIGCSDLSSPACRTYNIKALVAHPCYTPSVDQDHDDFAMMQLEEVAHLDSSSWAPVDGINGTARFTTGTTVTLAGFGTLSNTNLVHSNSLMRVDVPVSSQATCEAQNPYSLSRSYIDFASVICTGGQAGKDSCLGDSGGPVIWTDPDGVGWLVGVLSKGSELPSYTDWCAVQDRLGIYTRIRHYADFVHTTMQVRVATYHLHPHQPLRPLCLHHHEITPYVTGLHSHGACTSPTHCLTALRQVRMSRLTPHVVGLHSHSALNTSRSLCCSALR